MRREQKVVAVGAASGVAAMLVALFGLSRLMSPGPADLAGRLAGALRWDALAVLPLFAAIAAVGNARALSDAIDPTAGKESASMIVDGRVVDNTVQQYLLYLAATLSLAATPGADLRLVKAAALIFVAARIAFWIGYRIHPLYRAFGMAATMYLSLVLFGYAAWANLHGAG